MKDTYGDSVKVYADVDYSAGQNIVVVDLDSKTESAFASLWLTPDQARKLARKIRQAAESAAQGV